MKNNQYGKWLVWIIIASIFAFGGLAFILTPGYTLLFKAYCRMAVFFGLVIWATIIFLFISKNLNK